MGVNNHWPTAGSRHRHSWQWDPFQGMLLAPFRGTLHPLFLRSSPINYREPSNTTSHLFQVEVIAELKIQTVVNIEYRATKCHHWQNTNIQMVFPYQHACIIQFCNALLKSPKTRHQRMLVPAWGLIRGNGNTVMATRGAYLGLCGKKWNHLCRPPLTRVNIMFKIDRAIIIPQNGIFTTIFSHIVATRGPKCGLRDPKANQLWPLTQQVYITSLKLNCMKTF